MHMEFVTQLYRDQVAEGRYFLHEHPQFASSWDLECVCETIDAVARSRQNSWRSVPIWGRSAPWAYERLAGHEAHRLYVELS